MKGDQKMFNENSFGSNCPVNWEEIADFLNDLYEERTHGITDTDQMNCISDQIWEDYCCGNIANVPEDIF